MGWKETFAEGDVHWMSTGKGIIHAQIPGPQPTNRHVQCKKGRAKQTLLTMLPVA